jgi:hypothetical protein
MAQIYAAHPESATRSQVSPGPTADPAPVWLKSWPAAIGSRARSELVESRDPDRPDPEAI